MKRYGYLVVEGPHDIEFAARLLREYGLRRITYKRYLEPFWEAVIPKIFPINDNLLKRVPVPVFLENETHSIAIHGAQGITRLVEMLDETCAVLNHNQIASYGFILDADVEHPPQQRFSSLLVELKKQDIDLPIPANPGEVAGTHPSFGIYVLPDNQASGTLEDILLQCAQVNYTSVFDAARNYLQEIEPSQFTPGDLQEYNKPAGQKKAHVSTIASILKPGKAIQVSIQDNRWLEGESMIIPSVAAVRDFLVKLFELKK
jgi:hypothetical protein